MSIEFFIKAVPMFDASKFAVKECYRFVSGSLKENSNGTMQPAFISESYVDDGIRAAHAKEYEAFAKAYQDNQAQMNDAARANPGAEIKIPSPVMVEEKPAPKKESKVKKESKDDLL